MSKNVSCQQMSTKKVAFNCLENLLLLDEIAVDKYVVLRRTIEMFDTEGEISLGDGIAIKLVDNS